MGKIWQEGQWIEQSKYCPQCKGHHPWKGKICDASEAWKYVNRAEMMQEWQINAAWRQQIRNTEAVRASMWDRKRPVYTVACPACRTTYQSYDNYGVTCSRCDGEV